MNKWFLVIFFNFFALADIGAQSINGYEYWFDENYTSRIQVSVSPRAILNLNSAINTNGLDNGLHRFNFRAKDTNSKYSVVVSSHILKVSKAVVENQILKMQYWIDEDFGNAQEIVFTNPMNEITVLENIRFNNLLDGNHILYYRFEDKIHQWSVVNFQDILIQNNHLVSSITSGSWTASTTWDCNCVPYQSDVVTLNAQHSITVSNQTPVVKQIVTKGGNIKYQGSGQVTIKPN